MKYYRDFAALGVFTLEQAATITGNSANASKLLNQMIKTDTVRRIKKNLYTCVNLITGEDVADKYMIASHAAENAFLSYHSAFEFYGFYNQVSYDVQLSCRKRMQEFEYGGVLFRPFMTKTMLQVDKIQDIRVSSIERTIIDSINMLGKVMDTEELVKCMELIHIVREEKFAEILKEYNKDILYRKAGYVLSYFRDEYDIANGFFEWCLASSNPRNAGLLSGNEIRDLKYIKKWGLYAYEDLRRIAVEGRNEDV